MITVMLLSFVGLLVLGVPIAAVLLATSGITLHFFTFTPLLVLH